MPAAKPTPSTTQTGLKQTSDYVLHVIIITSDGKQVEVSNLIVNFNLYENIFTPYMTGDFELGDAHDILTTYSLNGNEYIQLTLDKPSLNKPINKYFRIYKISNREYTTQSLQNYKIHFCSEELILSTQMYVRKAYKGLTIDNMISDLFKTVLQIDNSKIGEVFETTSGNFDIIIPRMQPLEAAMWLTTRAYNASESLFFLFENRDGINFGSFETFLKRPVYTTYIRQPKVKIEPIDNMRSINYIKFVHDFDIINGNRYGAFATSIYTLDILNRKYNTSKTFTLGSLATNNFLNPNPSINLSQNRLGKSLVDTPESMQKFYIVSDSDPNANPTHPENWLTQHAIKLAQLNQLKIVLNVPLDVLIKCGCVVNLILPLMTPQDTSFTKDKYKSGSYLVASVHHGITGMAASTTLELLSDSYGSQLPGPVNLSGGLQDVKTK